MKRLSHFLLTAGFLALLTAPACADDAIKTALAEAQKAQDAASVCRIRMSLSEGADKKPGAFLIEIVNPDQLHVKADAEGTAMEMMTDGKRAFVTMNGSPMQELPAQAAPQAIAQFNDLRKKISLQTLLDKATDFKAAGHETLNGIPASVYTFTDLEQGLKSNNKLWISDKDHRPLKIAGEAHGEKTVDGKPQKVDRAASVDYDYDPSIKITLPTTQP